MIDSVCASTPGTSVIEFNGPVGKRPKKRSGRTARIRARPLLSGVLEVNIMMFVIQTTAFPGRV
jgi:hypothetical protein